MSIRCQDIAAFIRLGQSSGIATIMDQNINPMGSAAYVLSRVHQQCTLGTITACTHTSLAGQPLLRQVGGAGPRDYTHTAL